MQRAWHTVGVNKMIALNVLSERGGDVPSHFIHHSLGKYLLSTAYVPDTDLEAGDSGAPDSINSLPSCNLFF